MGVRWSFGRGQTKKRISQKSSPSIHAVWAAAMEFGAATAKRHIAPTIVRSSQIAAGPRLRMFDFIYRLLEVLESQSSDYIRPMAETHATIDSSDCPTALY